MVKFFKILNFARAKFLKFFKIFKISKIWIRRRPQAPPDVPTLMRRKSRLFRSRDFRSRSRLADKKAKIVDFENRKFWPKRTNTSLTPGSWPLIGHNRYFWRFWPWPSLHRPGTQKDKNRRFLVKGPVPASPWFLAFKRPGSCFAPVRSLNWPKIANCGDFGQKSVIPSQIWWLKSPNWRKLIH